MQIGVEQIYLKWTRENGLCDFPDTARGPADTNSVRDFQHPLEWSSILHKNVKGCATSVSNLVLLRSVAVGC